MSPGTILPDTDGLPAVSGGQPSTVSPERMREMLAHARDIIHGRVPPPLLNASPELQRHIDREIAALPGPVTPTALRLVSQDEILEQKYQGVPVGVYLTPEGFYSVLAEGEDEIKALFRALSPDEGTRVMIVSTLTGLSCRY